jgi:hypothetical protein
MSSQAATTNLFISRSKRAARLPIHGLIVRKCKPHLSFEHGNRAPDGTTNRFHGATTLGKNCRSSPSNRKEYRFTDYTEGDRNGACGRWVFGPHSLVIPVTELK